ncbi:SRPBCC family protein [Pseudonocardia acaciae]|uniref:SRPBCC family protein n=1 Tax=Pseudonocardia acaciae TaxID=551276 RepID=UPI0004914FD4|nr:SRPBCC domain-containing protein [Pseudonocardia acaciae]
MAREFEIRKEVEIDATPEQIWQAIATGPGITSWFMPHEVTPGEGGSIRLTVPGFEEESVITAWEPAKRLAYRGKTADDGTVHAMEYLIEGRDGGSTVLRFVHSGMLGDKWGDDFEVGLAHGWDQYLHTLGEYITRFLGRPVTFINANGPAASAAPDGWSEFLAGLGLDGPVEEGDQVRLTPSGLDPIEGVADYVREEFLGVRTDDGLYRFHGLGRMGMPIAVGHHIYRDDIDRAATEKAWTTFMESVYAS